MKISAIYRATGGERFITIGCFNPTNTPNLTSYVGGGGTTGTFSNIAYYYVDDVSLIDPSCDSLPLNRITSQTIPVCSNNQSFPKTLVPTHSFYNYLWSDSTRNNYNTVNAVGKYYVYTYTNNCPYVDTFNVVYTPAPTLDLGFDTMLCSASSFCLKPTHSSNINYLWSNNSTDSILQVNNNGNYWLKVTNAAGCSTNDSININFNIIPNALGNDIDLCSNASFPIKLSASKSYANSYLWFNNSNDSVVYVNDTGNYWVQITKGSCSIIDTINIKNTSVPAFILGNDTSFCKNATYSLTAPIATNYNWYFSSNINNPNFTLVSNNQNKMVTQPGLYLLDWKKNTCTKKDMASKAKELYDIFEKADRWYNLGSLQHAREQEASIFNKWIDCFRDFEPKQSNTNTAKICNENTIKHVDFITDLGRSIICIDDVRSVLTNKHKFRVIYTDNDTYFTKDPNFEPFEELTGENLFEFL